MPRNFRRGDRLRKGVIEHATPPVPPPHNCDKPAGPDVMGRCGPGTIWRCECGLRWVLDDKTRWLPEVP